MNNKIERTMKTKTKTRCYAIAEANVPMSKPFNLRLNVADQRNLEQTVKTAFDLARSEGQRLHVVFGYKSP